MRLSLLIHLSVVSLFWPSSCVSSYTRFSQHRHFFLLYLTWKWWNIQYPSIDSYSTYNTWEHTVLHSEKRLRHALDTLVLQTNILACKVVCCVRRARRLIFMKVTREISTVYKEGAYRSIVVCIFNQFCTFPSSSWWSCASLFPTSLQLLRGLL